MNLNENATVCIFGHFSNHKLLSVAANGEGRCHNTTLTTQTLLRVTSCVFIPVCLDVALPPSTSVIAVCSHEPTERDWRSNSEQSGCQRDDCRRGSGGLFITLRGHQTTRPRAYLSGRRVVLCLKSLWRDTRLNIARHHSSPWGGHMKLMSSLAHKGGLDSWYNEQKREETTLRCFSWVPGRLLLSTTPHFLHMQGACNYLIGNVLHYNTGWHQSGSEWVGNTTATLESFSIIANFLDLKTPKLGTEVCFRLLVIFSMRLLLLTLSQS